MAGAALELEQLTVYRPTGRSTRIAVVSSVTLAVSAGSRLALVGPNGAGKTSLLLAVAGALDFDGRISIDGRTLEKRSTDALRSDVGFLFAEPADQLFTESVFDEVAFGLRQRGEAEERVTARVGAMLERVGLVGIEDKNPEALSSGDQRRLAMAAVMVSEPRLLLCDEPTAALDPVARHRVIEALCSADSTLVVATHDLDLARHLEADAALLSGGRLIARGPAESIFGDERVLREAGLWVPRGR